MGFAMDCAAENGHLNAVQWLHQFSPASDDSLRRALTEAANSGHLEVARWLCTNCPEEGYMSRELADLTGKGDLTMLELPYSHCDFRFSDNYMSYIDIPQGGFQDPDDDPCDWDRICGEALESAVEGNQVETIEWLCGKYHIDLEELLNLDLTRHRPSILRWIKEEMGNRPPQHEHEHYG